MRRRLDARVTVSGQVRPEQVAALASEGVTVLVNNRFDGEAPGQPSGAEVEAAAREAGLAYVALPFRGRPTPEAVQGVRQALAAHEGEVHAFCGSGLRSAAAWALAATQAGRPVEEILEAGREAGYDLAVLFT